MRERDWEGWWKGRRVLFVSGTGGGSRRYRCYHRAEQLALLGAEPEVVAYNECDFDAAVRDYDLFVLHRVALKPKVERFLRAARARRKPAIFDSDDLVFDADAASLMHRSGAPSEDLARMAEKLAARGRAMQACDAATVSTEPLADRARRLLSNVLVVPNVVTAEMVRAAEAARAEARDRPVTLGYFSGTPTHDRDFAEVADVLIAVLTAQPGVRLLVVGPLALDERLVGMSDRVDRVDWRQLPALLAATDVNLAPLEGANAFTRCKSCVKYLEAGLVGVPTVASASPDFQRVIRDGENGLLADSPRAWREALERLTTDSAFRVRIGTAAATQVKAQETTEARALELGERLARLTAAAAPSATQAFLEQARAAVARGRRRSTSHRG